MKHVTKEDKLAERAALSKAAGRSFGRLLYQNNPGWTISSIEHFANNTRPIAPMLMSIYKQNLIEGFTEAKT